MEETTTRIRLHITSSDFPRWDRNPGTGAPTGTDTTLRAADQTVLHDRAHPSRVVLPRDPALTNRQSRRR
jgi:predicted acyl esterase